MNSVDSSNNAWSQTLSAVSGAMSSYLQDKMLRKMDTDGNGGVEQGEFQAALEKVANKLGVDVGQDASTLYASLDSDQSGALDGQEVGGLLNNLFASAAGNTQAFVQSRGDEARFAELDADADGMISMAEFGIASPASATVTQTTTVVTTIQQTNPATSEAQALAQNGAAEPAPVSEAAVEQAAAQPPEDTLQALLKSADTDGSGNISAEELGVFVNQLQVQAEAASRRYNETALASLSSTQSGLNESA